MQGTAKNISTAKGREFEQRLDFYLQYVGVFAVVLIIYSLLRGAVDEGTLTLKIYDPIVIWLMVFIVISLLSYLYKVSRKKKIIVGNNYIIFKNRFNEKRYDLKDIINISLGRERLRKSRKATIRVIKIRIKNRKMPILIRPSSFTDDNQLVRELAKLKKKVYAK